MCLTSRDPEERRIAVKRLARRALEQGAGTRSDLARRLGRSDTRVDQLLSDSDTSCLSTADLALWTDQVGPDLLEAIAREAGYSMAPIAKGPPNASDLPLLIASGIRETSEAYSEALQHGVDGLTPSEAQHVLDEINEAERALAALRARVTAAL